MGNEKRPFIDEHPPVKGERFPRFSVALGRATGVRSGPSYVAVTSLVTSTDGAHFAYVGAHGIGQKNHDIVVDNAYVETITTGANLSWDGDVLVVRVPLVISSFAQHVTYRVARKEYSKWKRVAWRFDDSTIQRGGRNGGTAKRVQKRKLQRKDI